MPDDLPDDLRLAIASSPAALWSMLADDAGCSLSVLDRDGVIRWLNDRALVDFEWHLSRRTPAGAPTGADLDPIGKSLRDILPPAFAEDRIALLRRVIDGGACVVYESVLRGVRQRVAARALQRAGGPALGVFVARRLRAGERVENLVPPGAALVRTDVHDYGPLGVLSEREMEVLRLVGEGLTSAEIAQRLHRSVRTVESHRESIGTKLGLSKGADLVRAAIRAGLAEMPDAPDAPDAPTPVVPPPPAPPPAPPPPPAAPPR